MNKILISILSVLIALIFAWLWGNNVDLITGGTFYSPQKSDIKNRAVSLSLNDILLFKSPNNETGAIKFNQMTNDWGADYTCWYIPPDKSQLKFSETNKVNGHVFERYWNTQTSKNNYFVTDMGSKKIIDCTINKFEWSASTWIYFPTGYDIAILTNTNINEINIKDLKTNWHKTKN